VSCTDSQSCKEIWHHKVCIELPCTLSYSLNFVSKLYYNIKNKLFSKPTNVRWLCKSCSKTSTLSSESASVNGSNETPSSRQLCQTCKKHRVRYLEKCIVCAIIWRHIDCTVFWIVTKSFLVFFFFSKTTKVRAKLKTTKGITLMLCKRCAVKHLDAAVDDDLKKTLGKANNLICCCLFANKIAQSLLLLLNRK
jgi:hypothetical protein